MRSWCAGEHKCLRRFHSMLTGVLQANYQGVKIPNEHNPDQWLLMPIIIEPSDYSRTNMTTQSFSCRKIRMADRWSLIQLKACFYSLFYTNLWHTVFLLAYIRTRPCGTWYLEPLQKGLKPNLHQTTASVTQDSSFIAKIFQSLNHLEITK